MANTTRHVTITLTENQARHLYDDLNQRWPFPFYGDKRNRSLRAATRKLNQAVLELDSPR